MEHGFGGFGGLYGLFLLMSRLFRSKKIRVIRFIRVIRVLFYFEANGTRIWRIVGIVFIDVEIIPIQKNPRHP
ncbi:hypothetical protein, partial [Lunatibacter salilacus]|uniref:hypothetical protein n=1 Tax=Lunatibacter salilacus TaxID=2483804 RepID=UPI001F1FA30E